MLSEKILNLAQHPNLRLGEYEEFLHFLAEELRHHFGLDALAFLDQSKDSCRILMVHSSRGCGIFGKEYLTPELLEKSPKEILEVLGAETESALKVEMRPLIHEGNLVGCWLYSLRTPLDSLALELVERLLSRAVDGLRHQKQNPGLKRVYNEHEIVLDFVPALIWYTDLRGRILRINQAALEISGLEPEDVQGQPIEKVWPDYFRRHYQENAETVLQSGLPVLGEIEELESQLGSAVWLKSDKIPHRGRNGRIVGMFTFAVDITSLKKSEEALGRYNEELEDKVRARTHELATEIRERQRFEDALRESSQKYEQLFSTVSDPILVYELESRRIVDVNEAAKQVYGYSRQDFLDMSLDSLNGKDLSQSPEFAGFVDQPIHLPAGWKLQAKSSGRCFPTTISGGMFTHNSQALGVAVIRDMSQDLRSRLELERARLKSEQAMRTKSEFLANISHEIRTPMNAILGFCELLEAFSLPEKVRGWVSAIASSGRTLLALINDILDLSRIEAGKMELSLEGVDISRLVKEVRGMFEHAALGRDVRVEVCTDPSLPPSLILDEVRVRQILVNLVGNAIKFTEQGFVRIKARQTRVHGHLSDIMLVVEDTGIGIPEEQQSAIFEAFRQQSGQSSRKYGGTGLGLAITRRLIEIMGGTISLSSTPGKGSRFEVQLFDVPCESEEPGVESPLVLSMDVLFETCRILVVDDIELNCRLIQEFLAGTGLEVFSATSGSEALARIQKERFDLILLDLRLEDMGGEEVAQQIRSVYGPQCVILGWTAGCQVQNEAFDGYLVKPCRRPDLIGELCRHLPFRMQSRQPETSEELSADDTRPQQGLEQVSHALPSLRGDLMKSWEQAMETCVMSEIEAFAGALQEVARQCGCENLGLYADLLCELSESFDIEHLTLELGRFPGMVRSLERAVLEGKHGCA